MVHCLWLLVDYDWLEVLVESFLLGIVAEFAMGVRMELIIGCCWRVEYW